MISHLSDVAHGPLVYNFVFYEVSSEIFEMYLICLNVYFLKFSEICDVIQFAFLTQLPISLF